MNFHNEGFGVYFLLRQLILECNILSLVGRKILMKIIPTGINTDVVDTIFMPFLYRDLDSWLWKTHPAGQS
jgi:hypothetical protein